MYNDAERIINEARAVSQEEITLESCGIEEPRALLGDDDIIAMQWPRAVISVAARAAARIDQGIGPLVAEVIAEYCSTASRESYGTWRDTIKAALYLASKTRPECARIYDAVHRYAVAALHTRSDVLYWYTPDGEARTPVPMIGGPREFARALVSYSKAAAHA